MNNLNRICSITIPGIIIDDQDSEDTSKTRETSPKELASLVIDSIFKPDNSDFQRSDFNSYKWLGLPNELPELHSALTEKGYIVNTTLESFLAVFREEPIGTFEPVKWHDSNSSELLFFVRNLIDLGLVANPTYIYRRLKGCFVKPDNGLFDSDFKSINQNLETTLSQPKQESIKGLINRLL